MCRLDFSLLSNMFLNVLCNMTNKLSRRTISIWDHGLHLHPSSASASLFSVCKLMLTRPPSYQQLILRKGHVTDWAYPVVSYRRSSCNFYFFILQDKGPSSVPCELMLTHFSFFRSFAIESEILYFLF